MNDRSLVNEWMELAYNDLDVSQYLFERISKKQIDIICYHCQQAAEKSLKAYLCAKNVEVPKTHDVGLLCILCNNIDSAFFKFINDCEDLEVYAVKTRYPGRIMLNEENAAQALSQARAIYDFILMKVNEL